jgi:bifunctional UDP-N-acetylglucosamine pyrophosphorylase/glucosamine-1-phosphate N-acetyltransferase
VVRGPDGRVERIVEVTDASPEELTIREGNTGVYLLDSELLASALHALDSANSQEELYLTDVVAITRARRLPVEALQLADAEEALGVNNRAELARATTVQHRRNVERLLAAGVTFVDPAAAWIDSDVEIGRDSTIGPGVQITGPTRIGEGVHVKAHTVIESSVLEDDVEIGPSAHLRPGTRLRRGVRIGNFVEVKNSDLGPFVKADHLSYIGDADVGARASFGCGAITVNYDWEQKHRTTVGEGVRIGCNANLIAPVALEPGSFVAAGTTVTKNVPTDAIAVSTGRQKNLEGWGKRRRARKAKREDGE